MEKINVLSLGGCAVSDIINSNRNHVNLYNLDVWLGSFSRQMWEPGKIASRVKEELHTIVSSANSIPSDFVDVVMQIYFTVKERRTPTILLDNLPKDTVVIIDPAYEIQNFYFDGNEIFDISLNYNRIVKKHMPEWFNNLVAKHHTHFDCGISEIAVFQFRALKEFLRNLKKLNVPVIAVDNLYTDKIFDKNTNSVVTTISNYNSRMPFGKRHESELERHNYSKELVDRFYELWIDYLPDNFKIFSPDKKYLYADLDHHLGYHPAHLHHTCRTALNDELGALIVEAVRDHKQKIILPTITKA